MDSVIQFIHLAMPGLYVAALLAIVLKIILVVKNKGLDLPAFIISFFRLYGASELSMTSNKKRLNYMKYNNYINYFLYFFGLLFIVMLLIFQKDMFVYN